MDGGKDSFGLNHLSSGQHATNNSRWTSGLLVNTVVPESLGRAVRRQADGDVGIDQGIVLLVGKAPHAPQQVALDGGIGRVGGAVDHFVRIAAQVVKLIFVEAIEGVLVIAGHHRTLAVVQFDPIALGMDLLAPIRGSLRH